MKQTLFGNVGIARGLLAAFMTLMGILHFTHGQVFASVVPDYLPWHLPLVYASGFCEIGLGTALCFEHTRVVAAWGLIALYVAVFPANLHMALHPDLPLPGSLSSFRPSPFLLCLRLPFQLVFLYWAHLYTRSRRVNARHAD